MSNLCAKTWGMYHTAQKTAERAVKMYEIKDDQLALVTFNIANVRWSTFLSTIRMVMVLVVNVWQQWYLTSQVLSNVFKNYWPKQQLGSLGCAGLKKTKQCREAHHGVGERFHASRPLRKTQVKGSKCLDLVRNNHFFETWRRSREIPTSGV